MLLCCEREKRQVADELLIHTRLGARVVVEFLPVIRVFNKTKSYSELGDLRTSLDRDGAHYLHWERGAMLLAFLQGMSSLSLLCLCMLLPGRVYDLS